MGVKKSNALSKVALTSLVALAATGISGCGAKNPVQCYGVAKGRPNHPIIIKSGQCEKLAGGKAKPATPQQIKQYRMHHPDFIKCYGVAAAGKNDCGTKTSACGGTVHTSKRADAWIALPRRVCNATGGRVVEPPKKKHAWKAPSSYHQSDQLHKIIK